MLRQPLRLPRGPSLRAYCDERLTAICESADLNIDRKISLGEFHRDVARSLNSLPTDDKGCVVLEARAQIPGVSRRMKFADQDQDGRLSFKEVVNARMACFDAADANTDDAMSLAECLAHERKLAARRD